MKEGIWTKENCSVTKILKQVVDQIDHNYQRDEPYSKFTTGFTVFDELTSGFQPGLSIIAGRPSMGVSTFATNIVEHSIFKNDLNVAFFSLQMDAPSVMLRLISSMGKINQGALRTGQLIDKDWSRLTETVSIIAEAKHKLIIDDSNTLSPFEIQNKLLSKLRKIRIDLIVIDNLQLMILQERTNDRQLEVSIISKQLKALSNALNIPVIVLSDINSDIEERPNKRPVLSDLYQSGSIEKDADLIVFIYRDEIYDEETADKGIAEINIAKQRYGLTGTVKLKFTGEFARFENLSNPDAKRVKW